MNEVHVLTALVCVHSPIHSSEKTLFENTSIKKDAFLKANRREKEN